MRFPQTFKFDRRRLVEVAGLIGGVAEAHRSTISFIEMLNQL